MKRWSVLVTAVLSFSILAGCAGGGEGTYLFDRLAPASGGMPGEPEPRSLILTHSSPAGSLTDQAAQLLKEKVEEASEGQLQIQIYPEDSLGNLDDGRWYFENGAVDMRIGAGPSDVSSIATWLPTLTGCTPDEVSQALRPGQPLWDLICQQAGDTLVLRGPYGKGWPVEQFRDKHLVVITGGTGLAPVRSMLNMLAADPGFCQVRAPHLRLQE